MKLSDIVDKLELRDPKPFFDYTKKWIDYVTSNTKSADISEEEWSKLLGNINPVAGIDRGRLEDETKLSNGQIKYTNEKISIIKNWDLNIQPKIAEII